MKESNATGGKMDWEFAGVVPNPWGEITATAGGEVVVPKVREYMDKIGQIAKKRDCSSRRHHYVPQAYLRSWSADGKRVRVLDLRRGTDGLRGIRDTCVRENFYRVPDVKNNPHNQVEAMLAVIDEEAARLLRIFKAWTPGDDVLLEDFMSLAVIMAFQYSRTPQIRRYFENQRSWLIERAGQPYKEFTTTNFVDFIFRSTYQLADQFSIRQMEIWDDPKGRFITSDRPIFMSQDGKYSKPSLVNSRHVFWPLSPRRIIVMSSINYGVKVRHFSLSRAKVDEIRGSVIKNAEEVVVATPGDWNLPAGKIRKKRPQMHIECEPLRSGKECGIRMTWWHGSDTIDRACKPLCAMKKISDATSNFNN